MDEEFEGVEIPTLATGAPGAPSSETSTVEDPSLAILKQEQQEAADEPDQIYDETGTCIVESFIEKSAARRKAILEGVPVDS